MNEISRTRENTLREAIKVVMADKDAFAAIKSLGSLDRGELVGLFEQGVSLATMRRIHEEQLYRLFPNAQGKGCTWEEFCALYRGKTGHYFNELFRNDRALGEGFCAAAARLGVARLDVRRLMQAPESVKGEIREIIEDPEGVKEDRLRRAVQQLVGEMQALEEEHKAALEESENVIARRDEEIKQRKKEIVKQDDRLRAREKENRELRAEWSPTEEEEQAGENITNENLQVRACLRRICVQIEALPDCKAIQTLGKGVRDDLVTYAEELSDVLLGVVNKAAKGKAS